MISSPIYPSVVFTLTNSSCLFTVFINDLSENLPPNHRIPKEVGRIFTDLSHSSRLSIFDALLEAVASVDALWLNRFASYGCTKAVMTFWKFSIESFILSSI